MLENNLNNIQRLIDKAIGNRREEKITGGAVALVAVSKDRSINVLTGALASGVTIFGENKVQEAANKIPLVGGGRWHFIGHLQSNKVKKAVSLFELIYSIDSLQLLHAVDTQARKQVKHQEILLQVNIAQEASKYGFTLAEVPTVAAIAGKLPNINLRGLMVIAPETDDAEQARPIFRKGYEAFCALPKYCQDCKADTLSMGMSGDFIVAVEEGANNIRLGTLLFGKYG